MEFMEMEAFKIQRLVFWVWRTGIRRPVHKLNKCGDIDIFLTASGKELDHFYCFLEAETLKHSFTKLGSSCGKPSGVIWEICLGRRFEIP